MYYLSFLLGVYEATANSLTMNSLHSPKNYVNNIYHILLSLLVSNFFNFATLYSPPYDVLRWSNDNRFKLNSLVRETQNRLSKGK